MLDFRDIILGIWRIHSCLGFQKDFFILILLRKEGGGVNE